MDTRLRFDLFDLVSVFSNDPHRSLLQRHPRITLPVLLQSLLESFGIDFRSSITEHLETLLRQLGLDEAEAELTCSHCHSIAARLLPWSCSPDQDATQLIGRLDLHPDGRWAYLDVYVRDPDPVQTLLQSIDIEQDHYPEHVRRLLGLV